MAAITSFAGLAALILAELGYSMIVAIETTYGQPRDSLIEGWSHLVSLGTLLFVKLTIGGLDALAKVEFWSLIMSIYTPPFFGLLLLYGSITWWRGRIGRFPVPARPLPLTNMSNYRQHFRVLSLSSLALFGGVPAFILIAAMFGLSVVYLPVQTQPVARAILQEAILKPDYCFLIRNLQDRRMSLIASMQRPSGTAAQCVAVVKDGHQIADGRLIMSASHFVLLFHPETGRVQRVPTDGAIVEVVDGLSSDRNRLETPTT
jgi:hypothetical protein